MKLFALSIFFFITLSVHSKESGIIVDYKFASIEYLVEQEIGRLVLPEIYKNLAIDIDITPLPGERAQLEANLGKLDGETMRIWTYGDENSQSIRVPTPYYYLETMPFILKDSNIVIREKSDLKNYKIGKVRGVKHTNNITQGLNDVYVMNSTENMFKMLLKGKVDVVLTNTLDGNIVLKRLGITNIVPTNHSLAVLPLYHYINQRHKQLVPQVNQEIAQLQKNGSLQKMIVAAEQKVVGLNKR